ncbi:hypothetical protein E8E12_004078 [Didymella heteroderae]|uniref:Uncharacterized protein n=1 Tax=Didymella heteroderae TaxID=1769908 RepID=A0A9P4WJ43_9PLEO|nr:hypothetical protein E8E12_004078 [Didymella heteroderae]
MDLGTLRWMRFNPSPLAFYAEIMPDQDHTSFHLEHLDELPPPVHSILEIKTTAGAELIFDDWDTLKSLDDEEEVCSRVRNQARRKFVIG